MLIHATRMMGNSQGSAHERRQTHFTVKPPVDAFQVPKSQHFAAPFLP
ncbi:hypothetical protein [Oleiagrimonas sp. MCCC 1A03011]|jgi:hypothetical protein|nr:hypothetical protein [Oleiagrimonas sp. MCCC 1A03011]